MSEMQVDEGAGKQRTVHVDYPANSKKAREQETKERTPLKKVVDSDVTMRKPSSFGSLAKNFISEDSGTVGQYVVMEVLLPALKNMVSDAVSQGIEKLLFGTDSRSARSTRPGYTNYGRFGSGARTIPGSAVTDPRPPLSRQAKSTHDFNELVIETRGEAEDVIEGLRECIKQYQVATVADLYDLVGLTGEFTDNTWGWYDLRSASAKMVRGGGYMLALPATVSLRNQ